MHISGPPIQISPKCKQAPTVSLVVPAHNAEATVATTLDSLGAQDFADWEAIVVDDGSSDGTAQVVEAYGARDPRIRLVRRPNGGVSAARNSGLAEARGAWLVFLDADDWLVPEALATLLDEVGARPELDAVHCGWTRIASDGRRIDEICPRTEEDMFGWHAHNCGFAIHSVLVRRELVARAGGFDPALVTCEDWDLWLRVSRLGARWGRVDAQLAMYRMRAASASLASTRLLHDGLRVVDRAHGRDERLAGVPGAREEGEDPRLRPRARLVHAVYAAALALGQGVDAVPMLGAVGDERCPELGPDQVAYALFEGVPLGAGGVPTDWPSFSTDLIERLAAFVEALERVSGAEDLALRAKRRLERLVAQAGATRPLFGKIATATVALDRPLADVCVDPGTERLLLEARYPGLDPARVELPVCDGRVQAGLIADAVAADHSWALLGAFFGATIEPQLEVSAGGGRLVVRRCGRTVVDVPRPADEPPDRLVHDHAGWELLLQEVCGDARTPDAAFYDQRHDHDLEAKGQVEVDNGWAAVELAAPLPELVVEGRSALVAASVGGATLAAVAVVPRGRRVSAGALRRAICTEAGFELCRLAVRQGVIGRPPHDGVSLRRRLLDAARTEAPAEHDGADWRAPAGIVLAPGWEAHAARALNGHSAAHVIARRRTALTGLSGSRRAAIPLAAAPDAVAAARAAGDPVIELGAAGPGSPALYVPDIVWERGRTASGAAEAASGDAPGPGRAFFERLFAAGADPWAYTSPYEQGKYDQTLSLLGAEQPARALELACAEGHFTRQLGPRVGRLDAVDVSLIALERARARCAGLDNVSFLHHDLFVDPIEGRYDLIVCSEVLYYAGDRARLDHAVRAVAGALAPGGRLLSAHANLVVDDPEKPGFDWEVPFGARGIGEAFERVGLELVEELSNPLYRLQAYRRSRSRLPRRLRRSRPRRAEAPMPDTLPPEVEERFLWEGGTPVRASGEGPVTWELPILMYHRVAPEGSRSLREWRVTPDQFEAQLHYLRGAGYRSAGFEDWQKAAETHRPLPGRRVTITFDDGYEDFAEHALPLLRQYGFEATVFLVSDRVGQTNEWDAGHGETLALMDWDTIRSLDGHGVGFGGHTASHPMLTALGLDEVIREASRCRATLVQELGHPVRAFAYPYGDVDAAVARMIGACGFEFGVTTEGYAASASVPMLTLPRMNVAGTDPFDAFVRMLAPAGG